MRRGDDTLRCSFCGKSQNEVKKLIAGPTVYICNECIDICNEIITDDQQQETAARRPPLPKPVEIKEFLDDYVIGQRRKKEAGRRGISITTRGLISGDRRYRDPKSNICHRPRARRHCCADARAMLNGPFTILMLRRSRAGYVGRRCRKNY